MAKTKAGTQKKFASKAQLFAGYRTGHVEIEGTDEPLNIRYRAPSPRAILKMQELGRTAQKNEDESAALESWGLLADHVARHLVDEAGKPLCTQDELMDAPLDLLIALMLAISPKAKGVETEVAAQGEG